MQGAASFFVHVEDLQCDFTYGDQPLGDLNPQSFPEEVD
jgi:hypothetical protein